MEGVEADVPFIELQTITKGQRRNQQGALVRGIPPDSLEKDPGLARQLVMEEGVFDLTSPDSIVLGAELALFLGVGTGDQITVMSMSGTALETLRPEDSRFIVSGIFRSGFYEYDLGWAFIPIETARLLYGENAPLVYGIKLENRWKDAQISTALSRELGQNWKVESWRSFNRAFFGALRTEKILMFILMGLIFVVVALNIFQGQRRTVMERYEEIGLLKAVGASAAAVRLIFTLDGFLIGFFGALAGLIPGVLIASNIQGFFGLLETVVNGMTGLFNNFVALFTGDSPLDASFSIFSSAVFYVKEIPARLVPFEVFLICLFGVGAATFAAWLASARSTGIKPAEVLRYE
jgi:lipoprotein-releasing system permease protein